MSLRSIETVPVDGTCDPRFEVVRAAFRQNFIDEDELGAAVCVVVGGTTVVDLWGGFIDSEATKPWRCDTLVNAFSTGKGVLAILALTCVEAGEVDLDATVDSLWPAFAAAGKENLTIRSLLAHRAGLPAVREPLPAEAMYDWDLMCSALAQQQPFWEPDRDHGYHVNTLGYLVGEVLRLATGKPVGELLRERVSGPAAAEYYWGLPRRLHAQVSPTFFPTDEALTPEQWESFFPATADAEHDTMIRHAYGNPRGISGAGYVNTTEWRDAAIPSTNGHCDARALAAIYRFYLAGGVGRMSWVGPELRAEATKTHSDGEDRVLGRPSRFGLGFQLPHSGRSFGPNPAAFGHFGHGGSLGLADPDAGLAFGYVLNRPGARFHTPRTRRLIEAVYDSL